MTASVEFTPEEWDVVREGPTSAGLIVSTAERGGAFREIYAMAKTFAEVRAEHGDSTLLDELCSRRPEVDRTRSHSPQELREHGLQRIREAVALVERKATPQELADYRRFVIAVSERVAAAKDDVSPEERSAISEIEAALGSPGS